MLSKIRRYITKNACINIFKNMVLFVIEHCDIVYAGTNLTKIENLFYRGLRTCLDCNKKVSRKSLCEDCKIASVDNRRDTHLLLFMHEHELLDLAFSQKPYSPSFLDLAKELLKTYTMF